MHFVYIIQSTQYPAQHYVGCTENVDKRIKKHNEEVVPSTKRYAPWVLVAYIAFVNQDTAWKFEKYLKSHSGRAFLAKHLLG